MNGRRNRRRGKKKEEDTKRYYENLGWAAVLTAPKEPCDLIIWNDFRVLAVEVKATARRPTPSAYKPLTKMRRGRLYGKIVCWWPLHARKPEIWEVK